jgi:hypothetical protein
LLSTDGNAKLESVLSHLPEIIRKENNLRRIFGGLIVRLMLIEYPEKSIPAVLKKK